MTPADSWPCTGSVSEAGLAHQVSEPQMAQALILTRYSPGPGVGTGVSRIVISFTPVWNALFMSLSFLY
ncbi:MAG: hypothetical protein V8T86_00170 [Victivallis sp.]